MLGGGEVGDAERLHRASKLAERVAKANTAKAREDAPPESGVRQRERGRSRKSQTLNPGTRSTSSRRLRRAA